ncbi:HAD-IA family hydrolase [Parachlamydia sp. AcF125]|uniref:HAD family hydrolase n=1 Tax=Parachlamydia sp. AcF125 TaxID=2795736 RepID=UPI001BC9D47E|nr:HAD-IA family hydrolase [Parachlamydia sp. AcF125]MBS4168287.1 Phosphorylated carbohydrates phosphatase [Parachlamydia sp. AcF125]
MTTLKVLLVDLDGTLADSLPYLYDFYQTFLARYGIKGSQAEFQSLNGPTLAEVVQALKHTYALKEPTEELIELYEQRVRQGYAEEIGIAPYAKETLLNLRKQGVRLGLVTSAKREFAQAFLQSQGIENWFAFICAGDHLVKGKPDPEIYEKACDLAACEKQQICAIEDSTNGVKAAMAAGLSVIQIDLHQANPRIAGNWEEIYQLLKKQYELPFNTA